MSEPHTTDSLKKLRVADLKTLLTDAGLDTSGKKDDLITRLLAHKPTAPPVASPPETITPVSPVVSNPIIMDVFPVGIVKGSGLVKTEAERRATREARFGISVPVVVTTGPKSAPMGAINVKPKIAGPVTITQLNYSEEEKAKMAAREAKFAGPVKVVEVVVESEEEKKRKIGKDEEEEKKRKRAERFGITPEESAVEKKTKV